MLDSCRPFLNLRFITVRGRAPPVGRCPDRLPSQLVRHDHAPADRLSITQLCATADGISRFLLSVDVARAPSQPVPSCLAASRSSRGVISERHRGPDLRGEQAEPREELRVGCPVSGRSRVYTQRERAPSRAAGRKDGSSA